MINGYGDEGHVRGGAATALGPRHARPGPEPMSSSRAAVLDSLTAEPATVTVLADRVDHHPNTVREHLDALVHDGFAERLQGQPRGRGRPAWLYRAAGSSGPFGSVGSAAGARIASGAAGDEYAALALALIDQLVSVSPDPRETARLAGERWGRTLADARPTRSGHAGGTPHHAPDDPAAAGAADGPAVTVVELLGDLRFEPQPTDDPRTVRLTTCPLLDAARLSPDVVCSVHLGIVRGALERLGGDPDAADLEPFAEVGACLLTLPTAQ